MTGKFRSVCKHFLGRVGDLAKCRLAPNLHCGFGNVSSLHRCKCRGVQPFGISGLHAGRRVVLGHTPAFDTYSEQMWEARTQNVDWSEGHHYSPKHPILYFFSVALAKIEIHTCIVGYQLLSQTGTVFLYRTRSRVN